MEDIPPPSLDRIPIDHTHPDEVATGFVGYDRHGYWKQTFVVCEAERYLECERDQYAMGHRRGFEGYSDRTIQSV